MNLGELDEVITEMCSDMPEELATKCLVKASTTDGLCYYRITGVQKVLGDTGVEILLRLQS